MKNLVTITMLIMLLASVTSCGFVHKVFDKKEHHQSERIKSNLDSAGSHHADSSASKSSDSSSVKKTEDKKAEGVEIIFSDSSDHNKIEVTTDSSGHQVIKAEGKIKTVKTQKYEQRKTSDSGRTAKTDIVSKSDDQASKVKSGKDVKTDQGDTVIHQEKKVRRIPWYGYLIGIFVLLLILLYLYYRYRKNIIAWFVGLKNPGYKVYYDPKLKGYQMIKKDKGNTS
jgi:hypothetical protein